MPQTGATQFRAQLELPDKYCAIKGLVVCNSWDIEPYDLLNSLSLGCYHGYDLYAYTQLCVKLTNFRVNLNPNFRESGLLQQQHY